MKKKTWPANRLIYYRIHGILLGFFELVTAVILLALVVRSYLNSGSRGSMWIIAWTVIKSLIPLVLVKWGAGLVYRSFLVSRKEIDVDRLYTMADSGDYENLKRSLRETKYFFINTPDRTMNTLLHYVTERGGIDMASFLVKKDSNVNARNCEGKTPLMLAAQHGYLNIAKLLLENGARTDVRTAANVHVGKICMAQDEMTALDYALQNDDTVMIELLKEKN